MSGSGVGHGVGAAVNYDNTAEDPTDQEYIEAEDESKAYEMLIAGNDGRWADVRALVKAGEDIHSGSYDLEVCSETERQ